MSLGDQVAGMVLRGIVRGVTAAAGRWPQVAAQLLADDEVAGIDQAGWYGLHSLAKAGAQAIVVAIGGDPEHLVALSVDDMRFRVAIEEGEVVLYDDLGQRVLLSRTGIIVDAPSIKLGENATLAVARVTDPVEIEPAWRIYIAALAKAAGFILEQPGLPLGRISAGSARVKAD